MDVEGWIVDNGSSHRGWTASARLNDAYPNAHMIHLPAHASSLRSIPARLHQPGSVSGLTRYCEPIRLTSFNHEPQRRLVQLVRTRLRRSH